MEDGDKTRAPSPFLSSLGTTGTSLEILWDQLRGGPAGTSVYFVQ